MRKLASIQRITAIRPIEGADKIVAADVLGWTVVVGKDEFKEGDFAVYFEVDSWLDSSNPAFASFEERFTNWGNKRGMRLKTIKLRKQISQGLLMPMEKFTELDHQYFDEGADVTDLLKIEKWEAASEQKSNSGGQKASTSRPFPYFLRKTDQERVQNMINELGKVDEDETFEQTIKLDGSSMTVYAIGRYSSLYDEVFPQWEERMLAKKKFTERVVYKVKKFFGKTEKPDYLNGVCSRNIEVGLEPGNHFSQYVIDHGVIDKVNHACSPGEAIAFQGELIGPSIQDNYEKVDSFKWFVFDVFDIERNKYLLPVEARWMTDFAGLNYAPVLDKGVDLSIFKSILDPTPRAMVENILAAAEGPGMNPGVKREGVVFKSNKRDFSFKAISNSYLLKKG